MEEAEANNSLGEEAILLESEDRGDVEESGNTDTGSKYFQSI
jgi:hypothetical protein